MFNKVDTFSYLPFLRGNDRSAVVHLLNRETMLVWLAVVCSGCAFTTRWVVSQTTGLETFRVSAGDVLCANLVHAHAIPVAQDAVAALANR